MTGALEADHQQDGEGNGRARVADPRSKQRRGYRRSGFYALKATPRALGPRVLDRRTTLGKALAAWKADLVRDLGGDLTTQELVLVDLAVRQKLLLESVDAWLLVQPSLVQARKRAMLPVVKDRQALVDSLSRIMGQLGLRRRAVDGGDATRALAEVKRLREAAASAAAGDPGAPKGSGEDAPLPPPERGPSVAPEPLPVPAQATAAPLASAVDAPPPTPSL